MTDTDSIINLPRDEEIFRTVAGGYLDVCYRDGGRKEKAGQKKKQKLKAHMDEYGVDGTVVDSLVYLDEIICLLELDNDNTEKLRLYPSDNLLFADKFSGKNENGEIIPMINDNQRAQLTAGMGLNVIFENSRHFVAVRALKDPGTGKIFLLYRDSFGGEISDEFRTFAEREFGRDVEIVVIENQMGVMQQSIDGTTCGLRSVTSMASGGLFDRLENRIVEYGGLDNFRARNLEEHLLNISVQRPGDGVQEARRSDNLFPPAVVDGYRAVRLENLETRASQSGQLSRKEKREMRKLEKMQINQSSRPPEGINGSQGSRRPSLGARIFRLLSSPFRYFLSSVRSFLGKFQRNSYSPRKVAKLVKNDGEDAVMIASQLVQKKSAALGLSLGTAKFDEKSGQTVDGEATSLSITDYANPPERDVVKRQIENGNSFSVILKSDRNDYDFIGVRIFVDPSTQKTTVLRRGPAGTGVDEKFRNFLSETLGKDCRDLRIVNVESGASQPKNAIANCLATLTSLAEGGSLAKLNDTIIHGSKNSRESEKAQEKNKVLATGKTSGKADQKSLEARLGAAADELIEELGKGDEKALTPKFD